MYAYNIKNKKKTILKFDIFTEDEAPRGCFRRKC